MWRSSNSAANGSPVGDAPGAPLPATGITRGLQSGAGHGRRHAKAPLPHESAEPTSAPAASDATLNGAAVADGAGSRSCIQIAGARFSRRKTTQSLRSDEANTEEIGRRRLGGGSSFAVPGLQIHRHNGKRQLLDLPRAHPSSPGPFDRVIPAESRITGELAVVVRHLGAYQCPWL